jgi:hypothetical protein
MGHFGAGESLAAFFSYLVVSMPLSAGLFLLILIDLEVYAVITSRLYRKYVYICGCNFIIQV